jgi:hypothetical protein
LSSAFRFVVDNLRPFALGIAAEAKGEPIETLRIRENAMAQREGREENWPTEREIRNHAYEIYIARRTDERGNALGDWLAAEAQLKAAGERAWHAANRSPKGTSGVRVKNLYCCGKLPNHFRIAIDCGLTNVVERPRVSNQRSGIDTSNSSV